MIVHNLPQLEDERPIAAQDGYVKVVTTIANPGEAPVEFSSWVMIRDRINIALNKDDPLFNDVRKVLADSLIYQMKNYKE